MEPQWEFLTKSIYDPAVFWAMVTAVATVALVFVTGLLVFVGVVPLVRSRKAEVAERFRIELGTSSAQKIFFLTGHGFLEFRIDPTTGRPFFFIIQPHENIISQRLGQILGEQRIVLTFEMDDQILSPLEEVAYYEEKGVIDFDYVYAFFADYIDVFMSSKEVGKYIKWMRETTRIDVYRKLEKLHSKIETRAGRRETKNAV